MNTNTNANANNILPVPLVSNSARNDLISSNDLLEKYFRRIGYEGPCTPTIEVLKNVHLAHVQSIAFENLDTLLRRPIPIDTASIFNKLVVSGRGGWCYEQNGLLREVLNAMGFIVTDLCARVVLRTGLPANDDDLIAGTHRLIKVSLDGEDWIADAGFGANTLDTPVRLVEDVVQQTALSAYSIQKLSANSKKPVDHYVLRRHCEPNGGRPVPLYRFTLEPHFQSDWLMRNHHSQNFPGVYFQHMLMASRYDASRKKQIHVGGNNVSRKESTRIAYASADPTAQVFDSLLDFRNFIVNDLNICLDSAGHGISLEELATLSRVAGVKFRGQSKL